MYIQIIVVYLYIEKPINLFVMNTLDDLSIVSYGTVRSTSLSIANQIVDLCQRLDLSAAELLDHVVYRVNELYHFAGTSASASLDDCLTDEVRARLGDDLYRNVVDQYASTFALRSKLHEYLKSDDYSKDLEYYHTDDFLKG